MKERPRKLALCADDFGQSKEISSGIFDLIACRRVSATSVLTEGPDWPESSWRLRELQSHADIGIHLNLTHPFENTRGNRPLLYWLLLTQLGMVSRDWVLQRFLKQIDLFVKYFKRLPDYLDGHQHVHAFPIIRDAMMAAIDTHWLPGSHLPWVRSPDRLVDSGGTPGKALVLRAACRDFAAVAQQKGLRITEKFGGLYALQPEAKFEQRMRRWLHSVPSGTLLMVHPGRPTVNFDDPISDARAAEFNYLAGTRFAEDCHSAGVRLVRFGEL
ncbi:MAG: ChbG/HpnK family deacetylase [Oxalobacteraceae bacterium]|jgi:predicted glycoside hydrolase/deacetylase ChbG (UPF0249 family)|nr:ChbG/HpnK family deacetylase [Oxalobacteraceae bacterium]